MQRHSVAAIATAPGPAGISVIRLSGRDVYSRMDPWIRSLGPSLLDRPGGTFFHGRLISPRTRACVDDVLVLLFRSPRSYTGEDAIEIQGHGGTLNSRRILDAVLETGIEPASPGEFTRRAFLNGRMDLCQAEAVLDLIQSRSERAAERAVTQMQGSLSSLLEISYNNTCHVLASVEAVLDVEDTQTDDGFIKETRTQIRHAIHAIGRILKSFRQGQALRDGYTVVISGRPNVGKSTLMNALLDRARAIVSDRPGTTRDTLEAWFTLEGFPVRLIDTAGLHPATDCEIEAEGMRRTFAALSQASLNLWVTDGSRPMQEREPLGQVGVPRILVLNKSDLPSVRALPSQGWPTVRCSALKGTGLKQLKRMMAKQLQCKADAGLDVAISARHRIELLHVLRHFRLARHALWQVDPDWLLVAADLRAGGDRLGALLGRGCGQDVLDAVFSRFCVGK